MEYLTSHRHSHRPFVVEGSKPSISISRGLACASEAVKTANRLVGEGFERVIIRDPHGRYLTIDDLKEEASREGEERRDQLKQKAR